LNLRLHVVGQVHVLQKTYLRLLEREIIIDPIIEGNANEGESIKGRRTDIVHPRRRREANLHRDGVEPFHLFCGQTRRLCRDFKDHRGRIWIGFDIKVCESDSAANDEGQKAKHNNRPPGQPERNKPLKHSLPLVSSADGVLSGTRW
jgi:hypothetical protein